MKTALQIDEAAYNPLQKEAFDRECKEFQHFTTQIVPLMNQMKTKIQLYMQTKSANIHNYKLILSIMDKYEELNLANYVEGKEEKMIFGNTQFKNNEDITMKEAA